LNVARHVSFAQINCWLSAKKRKSLYRGYRGYFRTVMRGFFHRTVGLAGDQATFIAIPISTSDFVCISIYPQICGDWR